jgi:CRISPR-associated endonuclease/helicase Cas3
MIKDNSVLLMGLDGSNPLAFLAALGTLRTLTLALPDETVKMSWEQNDGAWRPRVNIRSSAEDLILLLATSLKSNRAAHPTRFVSDDDQILSFYKVARSGNPFEEGLDQWIAALTSDVHPNATSQLQLTRRDYFAGNLDQIMANTTPVSLHRTLFQPWRYDEKLSGQSLHIEATEDRRHAYQWHQPSGDPTRNKSGNMLGANRLAIEAIPLFLGLPSKNPDRLSVAGWTGVRSDDSRWTWPIWSSQIRLSVTRSLLALNELQKETPDVGILRERGVLAAYRCRRILVEKTPNLTPAIAIG